MRFLAEEDLVRLLHYQANNVPPPWQIRQLKEQIDDAIRSAELNGSVTGAIDMKMVHTIVQMKIRLDNLYADWAEGKLNNDSGVN
ncbi:MAG: hypothetical protein KW788_05080 [Candidatus Doudnabacteria bacterium]|nr:hypothetical protein [Candidatus Doudnabacteria bacterium]